jgi:hypothetical protein
MVVINPNLIKENKETDKNESWSVIISAFLIKSVTEYVCRKLSGTGKIYICDAPQMDLSFDKIAERLGLYDIARELSGQYKVSIDGPIFFWSAKVERHRNGIVNTVV